MLETVIYRIVGWITVARITVFYKSYAITFIVAEIGAWCAAFIAAPPPPHPPRYS